MLGLRVPTVRGVGRGDDGGGAYRSRSVQVLEAFGDEAVAQRVGVLERLAECGSAGSRKDVGGVAAWAQVDGVRGDRVLGQEPVVTLCGEVPGGVGVGGNDGCGAVQVRHRRQFEGLVLGQGGPEWGESDEVPSAGEGDRQSVQRPLDEHRSRPGREPVGADAEELGALGEDGGLRGVEVLGAAGRVVGVGVAAADEPDGLPLAVGSGAHDR